MNQLLYDHQLAKLHAQYSPSGRNFEPDVDLVGHCAGRITAWRRAQGLSETGWPRDERIEPGSHS